MYNYTKLSLVRPEPKVTSHVIEDGHGKLVNLILETFVMEGAKQSSHSITSLTITLKTWEDIKEAIEKELKENESKPEIQD